MKDKKVVKIRSIEDFMEVYGYSPKDATLEGMSEIEEIYSSSETIFEFTEKLMDYVGIKKTKKSYERMYKVASIIDAMAIALSKEADMEERIYG